MIPICIVLLVYDQSLWAGITVLLAALTDFLDGYIARKYKLVTNFGKLADPVADKLLVLTVAITLTYQQRFPLWAVLIIIARELMVDGLRLIAVDKGCVLPAGILGKVKTVCQLVCLILMLCSFPSWCTNLALYVAIFFTVLSGIHYFWNLRTIFKE